MRGAMAGMSKGELDLITESIAHAAILQTQEISQMTRSHLPDCRKNQSPNLE
jgi:hypothetical protein